MFVIGIAHAKGGAGKTTLAQVLASGFAALGRRIAMFDCDRERQLARWPEIHAASDWAPIQKPGWPENITLLRESDPAAVERGLDACEAQGVDYAIIDTEGGRSARTERLVYLCNLLLLPSSIKDKDLDLLYETYDWLEASRQRNPLAAFPAVMVVRSDIPPASRQRSDVAAVLAELEELPGLATEIPSRQVFARLSAFGPLAPATEAYAAARHINAQHLHAANAICIDLAREIEEMIG